MKDYYIYTDSTSDLPRKFYEDNFGIINFPCYINGEEFQYGADDDFKGFYNKIREGALPTTSMINPETFKDAFRPLLQEGRDILHISFSSGLSGTYECAVMAANELKEEFPKRKIALIDSKCATLGQGLLVYYALKKRAEGASAEENAAYLEDLKNHIYHDFTVENLFHLCRGGRLSRGEAIIGSVLQVKPLLLVNTEGKLISYDKVMGRRQSLRVLADRMEAKMAGYNNEIVFIGHGDCQEEAEFLADRITKKYGISTILIDYVGPIVGAHTGAGLIALFYLASDKEK